MTNKARVKDSFQLEAQVVMRSAILMAIFLLMAGWLTASELQRPAHNDPLVAVYAPGTASCGVWVEGRRATSDRDIREEQLTAYMHGYATAYNVYALPSGGGVLKSDMAGLKLFLDTYCQQHPTEIFQIAVAALINDQMRR